MYSFGHSEYSICIAEKWVNIDEEMENRNSVEISSELHHEQRITTYRMSVHKKQTHIIGLRHAISNIYTMFLCVSLHECQNKQIDEFLFLCKHLLLTVLKGFRL